MLIEVCNFTADDDENCDVVNIPDDPNAPRQNENHPSQSQLQGI